MSAGDPHLDDPHRGSPARRLGRRALRALKPVAAPFLHRFEWRVAAGVERSATAARLRDLEARAGAAAAVGSVGGPDAADRILGLLERLSVSVDALSLAQVRREEVERALAAAAQRAGAAAAAAARPTLPDGFADAVLAALGRGTIPLGDAVAVRTEFGYVLAPAADERLVVHLADARGALEPGTLAVVLALLPPGGTFVDVGAHVGTFALPAARRVGELGRVVAVEPAAATADLLRRTLAINGVEARVRVVQAAAGGGPGRAVLHRAECWGWNSLVPGRHAASSGTEEVEVATLDSLVPPGGRVDAVKVDAEGFELEVLRGMARVARDNPRLAVVAEFGPEHIRRAGATVGGWLAAFGDLGFVPWEIDEASGALRPLRETGLADVVSMNLLFLRGAPEGWAGLSVA